MKQRAREHVQEAAIGLVAAVVLFFIATSAYEAYCQWQDFRRATEVTQAIEPIVKPLIK